jgi:hypothetical protein
MLKSGFFKKVKYLEKYVKIRIFFPKKGNYSTAIFWGTGG